MTPSTPTFTGYWSVRSVDRLKPEHMDQVREQLTEAMERGDVLVAVEGMTFIWHELDRVTEDRIRQQERARLAFEVEALNHTIVLGGHGLGEIHEPTRAAVLSLLSGDAGGTS